MISKFEGIIISETMYGDSSKIINLFTRERGVIGIMCKGVKAIKNPMRTKTMKFTYGYFHIKYRDNKLSTLVDVDIINNLSNIKSDITLISYATYITELTNQVVKQNDDPLIYDIYINTMLKINEKQDPLILMNIIELKYLDFLGVPLNLESCVLCGNKTNIVTLDPDEGGYICQKCYTNQVILSPKAIKLIRMYYLVDIKSISKISISDSVAKEISYFLDKFYERYTGVYLKSKNFLKTISDLQR